MPASSRAAQDAVAQWLTEALEQDRGRPTALFHHYPLLPVGLSSLEADALPPDYRSRLVDIVSGANQVRYVISGHAHPGIMASVRASMTYRGVHYVLAPTLLNPRAFGEEYKPFRADLTDRNNGFYLIMAFSGKSVALTGAKIDSDYRVDYPEQFLTFDPADDPRSMTPLREIPAGKAVVNGSFEDAVTTGWHQTHRYRADDGRGATVNRDRVRHSHGSHSAQLRLFRAAAPGPETSLLNSINTSTSATCRAHVCKPTI